MKAVICTELGEPETLTYGDMDPPELGPGDVLIDVRAAGVNFPDILMVQGSYQARPALPFCPGFEAAGDVAEVGESVDSVAPGDRVMATFHHGGYAEQAAAPENAVVKIPDKVSYELAAGFPIVFGTAFHALVDRADLQNGESLVVTGAAGGVGLAAVEVGKALGARVIAGVGSDEKAEFVRERGADAVINYASEDLRTRIRELTDGRGADVLFDPVSGNVFDHLVRAVNWGGRLLVIGFTSGRISEAPTNLLLLKGFAVVGVFWGSFSERNPSAARANFETLLTMMESGEITPYVSATYPLEKASEALEALASRETTGKVVLEVR